MTNSPCELEHLKPALASGEELAFQELLDRIGPRLHRAAKRMLGPGAEADDAVQEVFVSLVRSRKRLGEVGNLTAYLLVSLHHAVGALAKRRQRQPVMEAWDGEIAIAHTGDELDTERLNLAIQSLPEPQRKVVALRIDGDLTFHEIGQLLGVNANTVASRYRYALQKLRAQLGKETC